jgi:predicted metal-dependent peptidase
MRVTEAVECDDAEQLKRLKIRGGGGTDFRPVFDWIDKDCAQGGDRPDALIYFTDTQGWFPEHPPAYPVIWVSLLPDTTVPWGDLIYAPIKAQG